MAGGRREELLTLQREKKSQNSPESRRNEARDTRGPDDNCQMSFITRLCFYLLETSLENCPLGPKLSLFTLSPKVSELLRKYERNWFRNFGVIHTDEEMTLLPLSKETEEVWVAEGSGA